MPADHPPTGKQQQQQAQKQSQQGVGATSLPTPAAAAAAAAAAAGIAGTGSGPQHVFVNGQIWTANPQVSSSTAVQHTRRHTQAHVCMLHSMLPSLTEPAVLHGVSGLPDVHSLSVAYRLLVGHCSSLGCCAKACQCSVVNSKHVPLQIMYGICMASVAWLMPAACLVRTGCLWATAVDNDVVQGLPITVTNSQHVSLSYVYVYVLNMLRHCI
jgi:hypothetical protein